jgi:ABC-2 type transport system permease protein
MLHSIESRTTVHRIAAKEMTLFFASPIAYIFLATFSAIILFVFFWGEAFFSRNIADIRPMFEWMPLLLIFLCATLTMRLWSEERRHGTLEFVLTQATPLWHFVVGKFLSCLLLLCTALLITLPLPITVSILGNLDWGPVWAGYLATIFMGAAYLSIGLFISSRSENQIVSLISTVAICGLFYLVGTGTITSLFSNQVGDWLRLLGTGSRFESITRGVINFCDIYYYFSLIVIFLALNAFSLERERWVKNEQRGRNRQWRLITVLIVANAIGGNLWLGQLSDIRVDITDGQQYSISEATKGYLRQLQEPLLIRGYFSNKTHPLLAPLVPQLRDLIKEYAVAGQGKVQVEFIDPLDTPELEQEANQKYGIESVPFQVADRYQSSIISSYFNILIKYGDEHQILSFKDLIEIKARGESDLDVQLRNPEYDLTRSVKKVLQAYQSSGNLFDTVTDDLTLTAYISAENQLPQQLIDFKADIQSVIDELKTHSAGRLMVSFVDPESRGGKVAQQISEDYGFQPMTTNLLSNEQFFFYLTLQSNSQIVQLPLEDLSREAFKRNLTAGIRRFANGFTKTVALITPESDYTSPYMAGIGANFLQLQDFLNIEFNVIREDLSDGFVSGEADILVVIAPKDIGEKQLFGIDQFLMKGGTVITATSPYSASLTNNQLNIARQSSGLEDWLKHQGLEISETLVLDPQNSAFPVPVTRNIGGFSLQEIRMLDYPYFADVRTTGLNRTHLITSELPQATMAWASPIKLDSEKNKSRQVVPLLLSSEGAWTSQSMDIVPKVSPAGVNVFIPEAEQQSHLLGVVNQGRFDSYFAGQSSPLFKIASGTQHEEDQRHTDQANSNSSLLTDETDELNVNHVIEHSPESARIILFSSNDFLRDQILQMVGSAQQTQYINTLQMTANAIDWSLEDKGLLSIRSRGHFNRTLPPMSQAEQMFWEYLNYGFAAIAIFIIAMFERRRRAIKHRQYATLLAT